MRRWPELRFAHSAGALCLDEQHRPALLPRWAPAGRLLNNQWPLGETDCVLVARRRCGTVRSRSGRQPPGPRWTRVGLVARQLASCWSCCRGVSHCCAGSAPDWPGAATYTACSLARTDGELRPSTPIGRRADPGDAGRAAGLASGHGAGRCGFQALVITVVVPPRSCLSRSSLGRATAALPTEPARCGSSWPSWSRVSGLACGVMSFSWSCTAVAHQPSGSSATANA